MSLYHPARCRRRVGFLRWRRCPDHGVYGLLCVEHALGVGR